MNDSKFVPDKWCNIIYDFPDMYQAIISEHSINSSTKNQALLLKQPLALMKQSHNTGDADILIPNEIRDIYLTYRPTPFRRAVQLEKKLSTRSQIYYKYEGSNISGSHKLNTAIAQAYYFKKAGVQHVITSTGAGQWGTAIAYACKLFNLRCTVFMVNISLQQKPQRKALMELFGATVHASPSPYTEVGAKAIKESSYSHGSLAIATGEAIELAQKSSDMKFSVGSGENHVLLHQTVIGNEVLNQIEQLSISPTKVYACVGAGSNFSGIAFPLLRHARAYNTGCDFIAVEPTACPKLTQGAYILDKNDFSGTTPFSKMYTLGANYIAPPIHAGGLRYHGTAELLSALYHHKHLRALAISEKDSLAAGLLFSEQEGILPAPESAYAIAAAIEEISQNPSAEETILINISGHGLFDIAAYEHYKNDVLTDEAPKFAILDNCA